MREIKFRAWDKNKNRMLSHSDLFAMDCSTDYPFLALIKGYYANSGARFLDGIDPVTMQYTGLKDKNGTEIYEGDIVTWTYCLGTRVIPHDSHDEHIEDYETEFYQVIFQDGAFKLFSKIHDTRYLRIPQSELEVIGNIYENPELLEEKQ